MGVRVLLAGDRRLELGAIKDALREEPVIRLVAEASSGRQALALVERANPDAVLISMQLPAPVDGLTCVERIKLRHPQVRALVMSSRTDEESVRAAFRRGADAFISAFVDPRDIAPALRQAVERTVFHAPVDGLVEAGGQIEGLSPREVAVLKALAAGLSNRSIAERLWVSEHTVKFHLTNIFRKTESANRTEAALWAHQRGLVDAEEIAVEAGDVVGVPS